MARQLEKTDSILMANMANRLSTYHQIVRNNYNFGSNRYTLDYAHIKWLFDPEVKPIYYMSEEKQREWLSTRNHGSVFVASEAVQPEQPNKYIQRTGICLIETAELRRFAQRMNQSRPLTEAEALAVMQSYPTETQLMRAKPVLGSDVVVYLEDTLFEEKWDEFTAGAYRKSPTLQQAFQEQIYRTQELVRSFVRTLHPSDTPSIRFVLFSDIWSGLSRNVAAWVDKLQEIMPYTDDSEPFEAPRAAHVLYTYGVKGLQEISGLDISKEIVLVRQLSHCVLERSWTTNKSKVMDWFREAITLYFKTNPCNVVGYLDLYAGQSNTAFSQTDLKAKVSYGNLQHNLLRDSVRKPFPLYDNPVFQRSIVCDFDPNVLDSILRAGSLNEEYRYEPDRDAVKAVVREEMAKRLSLLGEAYEDTILPLFKNLQREVSSHHQTRSSVQQADIAA